MFKLSETITRKFIDSIDINEWEIETDSGWEPITHIHKTIEYDKWLIITESGLELFCADTHIVFLDNYEEVYVKNLIPNISKIITKNGLELVVSLRDMNDKENMFDLTIASKDHRFYTNDILSHNSTMLDALCFVLFGKAFRNINKGQLLNSINQKDCLVEIEFNTNGKIYKVIRGIKPNKFEIYQDDILLNQESSVKDYQEILEKNILKFNYKSFTQIVILGSASFVPFMQLSTSDRRVIIEDLLDIQIFSVMNTITKDKSTITKDTITTKKTKIELLNQRYELEKKHITLLQQNNDEKIKEYDDEIFKSKELIDGITVNIDKLLEVSNQLQKYIDERFSSKENIKKLTKIETTVESKQERIKKDINFFKTNGSCPTCHQDINELFKNDEILKLEEEVSDIQKGLIKLEAKINKEQEIVNDISVKQSELQKVQLKVATNNTTIRETNKYITKLNTQISNLKQNTIVKGDIEVLEKLTDELNILNEDIRLLLEEKTYYEVALVLLKDNGIKTQIIKQYLPIINKLVNKYLTTFDFFVNFNLDESFKETIKSRHRDEFTYNNFSEGEKTKINLSLLFSWREIAKIKNSAHTNLLILDEIFDSSLDDTGIDYLLSILHKMEDINIHVISHKGDILFDKFDRVLEFQKSKNFSKMKKL